MTLVVKVTEGGEPTRNNQVLGFGATELHKTYGKERGQGGKINTEHRC